MAVMTEAVADVAEQVATEALEVADVARSFSGSSFGVGVVAGALIAGGVTYFLAEKKLRGKYEALAEEEIQQMREHFHAKAVVLEGKPALDGLVKDLGYVPIVEEGDKSAEASADPGTPNTTVESEKETKNIFSEQDRQSVIDRLEEIDPDEGWDYDIEKANRSPKVPYVIHKDEQGEIPGLSDATWTYYEADDVLCDARDKIIDSREDVLGSEFVDKFGHGSGDPNVVYIRNEDLMCEIEVCRSPNSYAEEVHGIRHSDESVRRFPRRVSLDDE